MSSKTPEPSEDSSVTGIHTDTATQVGLYQQDIQFVESLVTTNREGFLTDGAPIARVLVTGGSRRWNTGFPDWKNQETYGGTLRLQNSQTGDPMICSYIETSTKADCSIAVGEIPGRLIEARNSDTVGYGADDRVTNGHHAWSTWVKFHFQDLIYTARVYCYC